MKVLGIGLLVIGGIIAGTVVDFILENRKDVPAKKDPGVGMLSGVVTDISKDEGSGLTRITVKDDRGNIRYGFSSISSEDLKHLYMGKGRVEIPVLKQEAKR